MRKKIITILSLLILASCQASPFAKEGLKSAKSSSASGRINASDSNSRDMLKELDE